MLGRLSRKYRFFSQRGAVYKKYRRMYDIDGHKIVKAYAKTEETVLRTMVIEFILCFFCLLTIFDSSDKDLIIMSSVALPFRLGYMSFSLFIVICPVILLLMRAYLQVYYQHLHVLGHIIKARKLVKYPLVSFDDNAILRYTKYFMLYLIIPFSMIFFVEKSKALADSGLKISILTAIVALVHLYFLRVSHLKNYFITFCLLGILFFGLSDIYYFRHSTYLSPFRAMNLQGADLCHANLTEHFLEKANLQESNLKEAKLWRVNLRYSQLQYANLSKADLWRANLQGANMQGANLVDCYMLQANLQDAHLEHVTMKNANLKQANLQGASLKRAFLRNAKLEGANLSGANLAKANLKGAKLHGADLKYAIGVTQKMLDRATGDHKTKIPSHLHVPEAWALCEEEED